MTTIEHGAYIAALEKKLMEAERALHGFRCIFNNYTSRSETQAGTESRLVPSRNDGEKTGSNVLFEGQYIVDPTEATCLE